MPRSPAPDCNLEIMFPDLVKEWDYTKNSKSPSEYLPGSHVKVWWKCSKCGYEWQASIQNRSGENKSHGTGCPMCAGKILIQGKNDLASQYPAIAAEWHPTKNDNVTPDQVFAHSNKSYWWKCSLCGNSWKMKVNMRTHECICGCPECHSNTESIHHTSKNHIIDIAALFPNLVHEWDKSNKLNLHHVNSSQLNKLYTWKCQICGSTWKKSLTDAIHDSNLDSQCEYCTNILTDREFTDLLKESLYNIKKYNFKFYNTRITIGDDDIDIYDVYAIDHINKIAIDYFNHDICVDLNRQRSFAARGYTLYQIYRNDSHDPGKISIITTKNITTIRFALNNMKNDLDVIDQILDIL